ncbi:MAG: type II toxin-antitoxin system HicA family toxin [Patescibacteria group bacterium]
MVKLPRLNAKDLATLVEKRGFKLIRQSGSHRIYKNESGIRLTIPFHTSKTLHPKIIKQIFRDADL